jgi:hypothetical protein
MLADQFALLFRDEHRKIRDSLLDLIEAFRSREKPRIEALLQQTAVYTGPHFRYEEEALYPALVEIFGPEYVQELLGDHDRAIASARKLVEIAAKEPLSDRDAAEAISLVRTVLPHVSDCDGLSIMVERLPETRVQAVLDAREASRRVGLNLFQWVEQVRPRPGAAL